MSFKLIWFSLITEKNIFYGATVVASSARITHTLHHCQLSDTSTIIKLHVRIFEREIETDRNIETDIHIYRERATVRELCFKKSYKI